MSYSTPNSVAGRAGLALPATTIHSSPALRARFSQNDGRPRRVMPLMRKVEVVHGSTEHPGDIAEFTRIVPAIGAFDEAFAAFARGALMATDRGTVAVEDLWPGDMVKTADSGFQPLLWRGSTIVTSAARAQEPGMGTLTRISADALGIGRPLPDLVLGPRAALSHCASGVRKLTGAAAAFVPARDFIDGINIVELTPPTAAKVFHLGFAGQHRLIASGVEVASMHPGPIHRFGLRGDMLMLFLSCFPHIETVEDFGPPLQPKLRLADLNLFDVA